MQTTDRHNLLFIQVPRLDNDVTGPAENVPLAAAYLRHAVEQSPERQFWKTIDLHDAVDSLDDRHLVERIVGAMPAVIAATLYLWNVERTLRLLKLVRRVLPRTRIVVGGPEVARGHPFLFRRGPVDAAVTGEGEAVFPHILRAFRVGGRPDYTTLAWRTSRGFAWGRGAARAVALGEAMPPPSYAALRPDARGMAYLETSRGCAWNCAFCCYDQRRARVAFLPAANVIRRVKALKRRGAREIRFIDPTFNSNPEFESILRGLAAMNRGRALSFFAELRPELLTREQCALLAAANVKDVETGIQSRDPRVLSAITRRGDPAAAERGVNLLSRAGMRITIDIMCGLPQQGLADIRSSLGWASRVRGARIQFLHLLLLPGTELRRRSQALGLKAMPHPPYRVMGTSALSAADFAAAERLARHFAGGGMDCPAMRFVGRHLPDLFPEAVRLDARRLPQSHVPGRENRRALIIRGADLYAHRAAICALVRRALAEEPHMLWQFVLAPESEEPLDLLDRVIEETLRVPAHVLDGMTVTGEANVRAARRVFVLVRNRARFSRSWVQAAERLLSARYC